MRTETIKLYKFKELSEEVQEKVIEKKYDINLHHDWWESVYESFKETMPDLGFDVNEIYFSGFHSQGDGAMFEGSVNENIIHRLPEVLNKHKSSSIKNWNRVLKLIKDGHISFYGKFKQQGHYCHHRSYYDTLCYEFQTYYLGYNLSNIENVVDDMIGCIKDIYEDHCIALYKELEQENKHLTSDEQIIKTIECNYYEFTEGGEQY